MVLALLLVLLVFALVGGIAWSPWLLLLIIVVIIAGAGRW